MHYYVIFLSIAIYRIAGHSISLFSSYQSLERSSFFISLCFSFFFSISTKWFNLLSSIVFRFVYLIKHFNLKYSKSKSATKLHSSVHRRFWVLLPGRNHPGCLFSYFFKINLHRNFGPGYACRFIKAIPPPPTPSTKDLFNKKSNS